MQSRKYASKIFQLQSDEQSLENVQNCTSTTLFYSTQSLPETKKFEWNPWNWRSLSKWWWLSKLIEINDANCIQSNEWQKQTFHCTVFHHVPLFAGWNLIYWINNIAFWIDYDWRARAKNPPNNSYINSLSLTLAESNAVMANKIKLLFKFQSERATGKYWFSNIRPKCYCLKTFIECSCCFVVFAISSIHIK